MRIDQPSVDTYKLASEIAQEVTVIWNRARVPTIAQKNVISKVVETIDWWRAKHNTERYLEQAKNLFDIAPKLRGKASETSQNDHVKNLMRQGCAMQRRKSEGDKYDWEVDFAFYLDQAKGDRIQTLGVTDDKLHQAEKAAEERVNKRVKYLERQTSESLCSVTPKQSSSYADPVCANDSNDSDPGYKDDDDYKPPPQPSSPTITLTLPRRGLLSGTADLATRCKISHRNALALTAKLVKMGGGQLKQCSLSASTSLRQRTEAITEAESKIKADFASTMPAYIILHWDGKVIKYANRKESDERLAIVMSSPQLDHNQFLAAPRIPDGTGTSMRDALLATLNVWDIPSDNIIGMCWDTTASNTGRRQGSATLFEEELHKGIMWLACRHHIGELHIKHADIEARGAWAGPTDKLFESFRTKFQNIQVDPQQFRLWTWPDDSRPHTFLVTQALDVRSFLQQHLLEDVFGRDDYRELCELIIKYLGGQVIRPRRRPGAQGDDFVMRAPGALHHARFLASCLYILKIVMLADMIPQNFLTPNMRANLDRMAIYISLFHGPWFLQARVPASAPRLDLQLWEHMVIYQNIDGHIAQAVRQSLLRHLWYLTEHLVVFAFFDKSVDPKTKEPMAIQLSNTQRPYHFEAGKPEFPNDIIVDDPSLEKFIGPRSWLIFHLLGANGAWLTLPYEQWGFNQEYNDIDTIVKSLEVVNDVAERGVKDIQDYADAAQDGAYRERIILVSNSHRIKIPRFIKNELEENL